jgi:hypothetical protein
VLFVIKLTRKVWTVMLVTRWCWWEASVWSTRRSSLKGWSIGIDRQLRIVTPVIGIGICLGGREEGYEAPAEDIQ